MGIASIGSAGPSAFATAEPPAADQPQASAATALEQTPPPEPNDAAHALPAGVQVGQAAAGVQPHPFDVTLSQLAASAYGTRGDPPPGWTPVGDDLLRERGIEDPAAWRAQFLGAPGNPWEFGAQIHTDGQGNFILNYRGTAEGGKDWLNNLKQSVGLATDPVDKFSGVAVNTAKEFQRLFGTPDGDRPAANLAITGHSQGAALAAIGALATGVPAVTFGAPGVHPATLERLGFVDPQAAQDIARDGLIRTYALNTDILDRSHDTGLMGLLLPDPLGTRILVEPRGDAAHDLFARGARVELPQSSDADCHRYNALVEFARHSGIPLVDHLGTFAYNAMSHNPGVLTDAMIQTQPWQPGHHNPDDPARQRQAQIPDALKDAYLDQVHDTAADIAEVIATDLAAGDHLRGGFRIAGDVGAGAFDVLGDSLHHQAQRFADDLHTRAPNIAGDLAADLVADGGRLADAAADAIGRGIERGSDWIGARLQDANDWIGQRR